MQTNELSPELLHKMHAYRRAANYFSVGQMHLYDNPALIVACVVGDGEAETGPPATAWHSNKFLDPQTGEKGIYLKQQLKDKLIEHKQYINKHGRDLPEIRNWKWKLSHE
jgi:phosphoketolase